MLLPGGTEVWSSDVFLLGSQLGPQCAHSSGCLSLEGLGAFADRLAGSIRGPEGSFTRGGTTAPGSLAPGTPQSLTFFIPLFPTPHFSGNSFLPPFNENTANNYFWGGMKVLKGWLPVCATADVGDTFNVFI